MVSYTGDSTQAATQLLQPYLNMLQDWFISNRLTLAPSKLTVILFINWTGEHRHISHLAINNIPLCTYTHT